MNEPKGRGEAAMRRWMRDPKRASGMVLGLLVLANVVAAALWLRPAGGSEQEMARELARLRQEVAGQEAAVARLRSLVENMEENRRQAAEFMQAYFLDRKTAYSTLLTELQAIAEKAGVRAGEHQYTIDPVEGSEDLAMLTINGNYQGTYADLLEFVNQIDRSPRLLIIERLQAQPTQNPGVLTVGLRLNAFVRGEASEP